MSKWTIAGIVAASLTVLVGATYTGMRIERSKWKSATGADSIDQVRKAA